MTILRTLGIWLLNKATKKITHKDLEFAFHDLNGRAYYRYHSVFDLPFERFGKGQQFIMWMSAGMTAERITQLIQIIKGALGEVMKEMVSKEKKANALIKAGAAINEMEMAVNMVIHTELLYQFVAVHYIREDEPIETINETIQQEKVEAFKLMTSQGGAYDFFSKLPELASINKSMNLSPEEWEEYWSDSIREQKRLKKVVEYLNSERKLEQDRKTYATK